MAYVVPLIRAAAVVPLVRWLEARGHLVQALLRQASLDSLPLLNPMEPVSLVSAMGLLRLASQIEGPDVGCRVVSETSLLELLLLGKVAIGTRTPREALTRIARALPYFCTHEHLTITPTEGGISVRHFFAVKFDANTLHLIHQYVAFMLQTLCNMTGIAGPLLWRIEMSPHPEHGLRHLQRWFGNNLVATTNRTLTTLIDKHVVDRPFPTQGRDRMAGLLSRDLMPLQGDGTYSGSVQILIAAMLGDGRPTLERLSAAAGTSVRTLQRRLDAEGASFSTLLDSVRRSRALELLAERNTAIGAVSAELGYARQASLTRAVRRWTGRPPRLLKSESG